MNESRQPESADFEHSDFEHSGSLKPKQNQTQKQQPAKTRAQTH